MLEKLTGDGAVDRKEVGAMFCKFMTCQDSEQKEQILEIIARTLDLDHDQYVDLGLRSRYANKMAIAFVSRSDVRPLRLLMFPPITRWGTLQQEITEQIDKQEMGLSDAFATYLNCEN